MRCRTSIVALLLLAVAVIAPDRVPAQVPPPATMPAAVDGGPTAPVQAFLDRGDTAGAVKAMTDQLAAHPDDDQARFSLGTAQFFQAVEHLSQSLYKHGVRHSAELHLPIPDNDHPELTTYEDVRRVARQLIHDVDAAEATLAGVRGTDVKLPLHIGTVRLDFTGSGHPAEDTMLWQLLKGMWGNPDLTAQSAQSFYVMLDAGDVQWLRGYCHLISAGANAVLAYDEHDLFDRTAQLVFKRPEVKYPFLLSGKKVFEYDDADVVDLIAAVHTMRFPLKEPLRMIEVRRHLKGMIACSRQSWKLIEAETDDDHEWIPNPRQHTVVPHVRVTQEMVDGWLHFLDQFDDILDGKVLIPFWRGDGDQGVNLAKLFFTDPQPFDLVLWVQGTGVAAALETGKPLASKDVYQNLDRVFGGDVFAFGAWFN